LVLLSSEMIVFRSSISESHRAVFVRFKAEGSERCASDCKYRREASGERKSALTLWTGCESHAGSAGRSPEPQAEHPCFLGRIKCHQTAPRWWGEQIAAKDETTAEHEDIAYYMIILSMDSKSFCASQRQRGIDRPFGRSAPIPCKSGPREFSSFLSDINSRARHRRYSQRFKCRESHQAPLATEK
jgi:hypothetical protein